MGARQRPRLRAHALQSLAVDAIARAAIVQGEPPGREILVVLRGFAAQDVAFAQQRGDVARERAMAECMPTQHSVREPRFDAQRGHRTTVCGHASIAIGGVERGEQLARLRERTRGWRVEPPQSRGVIDAGAGEFERERGDGCVRPGDRQQDRAVIEPLQDA